MVVEGRRAAAGARQAEQLLHRLVHQPLELGHLARALGGRVLGQRLQPQQDRGERLVHLVVQVTREAAALLLLRAHRERARAAALLLDAVEQAPERVREAVDLLDRLGLAQRERWPARRGRSLDPVDQALERPEAALQHPEVHAEREHDREREDQERPALVRDREVEAGSEAGREERERDEHHVRGHDLADEGVVAA